MASNQKGRVGKFKIFHIGKMAYTVEDGDEVLCQVRSISEAWRWAARFHDASKSQEAA